MTPPVLSPRRRKKPITFASSKIISVLDFLDLDGIRIQLGLWIWIRIADLDMDQGKKKRKKV
jgi:hypothetical protein